ncbi:MAG: phosphoenolpyruvate carboxykinase (ATP) [Anaerolineaceae bacterium]|nr:phosphoenolpyruvate carboxykinase (ATP) [Anaerolineaceae bacterium]
MAQSRVYDQVGLEEYGLTSLKNIYWNLPPPLLVEHIILRNEGKVSKEGAVLVNTGKHTGRSPHDKFLVANDSTINEKIWWGKANSPFSSENFDRLYNKICMYLREKDVYVQDLQVGAHHCYHFPFRIITEKAWHSLFARNLLRELPSEEPLPFQPEYTLICCPDFVAIPEEDTTRSAAFILINFERKLVLIGGTSYAGEIKKSIFTVANYLLPLQGVLSMHCAANVGNHGDAALFFGLSGTGKTTLSSTPDRQLIGDDEHGWTEEGIFNIEGGCYAKTIRLRRELEPSIWNAAHRFGTVLENVVFDTNTREIFFDNETLTENTRAAYPLAYVENASNCGCCDQPENIFLLSADAFGVLPPVARLTTDQALYYFLSGYTSKLAGTEKELGKKPQTTFSTCFAAPFLPLHPQVYAELLAEKISRSKVTAWLINTGWTGGPYGVGERFKLPYTRAIIRAALEGLLAHVPYKQDPFFGLWIPESCPGVPPEILDPQAAWEDQGDYIEHTKRLIYDFKQNFIQFSNLVSSKIINAGPP